MSENTQENVALTLQDLKTCVQIIEICSQRGAFKTEEFQAVGSLHQKMKLFLSQSEAPAEAPAEESSSDTSTEETKND